jgi:hypothetical protein
MLLRAVDPSHLGATRSRLGQSRLGARRSHVLTKSCFEISLETARECAVNHPKNTHHGFQCNILLATFCFRDDRLTHAAYRGDLLLG